MDYVNKQENYEFWKARINNSKEKVCSNDENLSLLESEQIIKRITQGSSVLEVGCGNGLLFEELNTQVKNIEYIGTDFVSELVELCQKTYPEPNAKFFQLDMTDIKSDSFDQRFDYIISKRAIQNVLDAKLQLQTIDRLGSLLKDGGKLILVESSQTSLNNLNEERKVYGLPEISAPFHNLFFEDSNLINYKFSNIKLEAIDPFASNFYFITRIIYRRLCDEYLNEEPNYDHPLNKIAVSSPGNLLNKDLSQVKTWIFQKLNSH